MIKALPALLAVSAGVLWFNLESARHARIAIRQLAVERAALNARLLAAERANAAADQPVDDPAPDAFASLADPVTRTKARAVPPAGDLYSLMAADPTLYALGMKATRANLPLTYGPLFRTLGLRQAQIDTFEALASQHEEAMVDIAAAAASQGVPCDDPAIAALSRQESDRYQSAEQALLGEPAYRTLQEYLRVEPIIGIVNSVTSNAALTEAPLTTAQDDQLSQILANASAAYRTGGAATPASIDWNEALGQAKGILLPSQFVAFQAEYAQDRILRLKARFLDRATDGSP